MILLLDIGCITDLVLLVEIEPILLAYDRSSLRPHRKLLIVLDLLDLNLRLSLSLSRRVDRCDMILLQLFDTLDNFDPM